MPRRWIVYSESASGAGDEPRGRIHFCDAKTGQCPCGTPLAGQHIWDLTAGRASADAFARSDTSVCHVCNVARTNRTA